jgi:hypothetical protein
MVPVWSVDYPTTKDPKHKLALWTCPVSAVPEEVWDMFRLWNECRLIGLPPVAGGVLDQPAMVRKAFPVFAQEYLAFRRRQGDSGAESTGMAVAAAIIQGMFGGGGSGGRSGRT